MADINISEWQRDVPYTAGSVVTYHGHKWTAKQWNFNEVPGGASGAWIDNGPYVEESGIRPWKRNHAYNTGDVVSYKGEDDRPSYDGWCRPKDNTGHKWTAKQWNYNEVPGGASGAWIDNGPYVEEPGILPWKRNQAYNAGDVVSYKGHKWTAKQWNYNEVPGGTSGAWTDNGPL